MHFLDGTHRDATRCAFSALNYIRASGTFCGPFEAFSVPMMKSFDAAHQQAARPLRCAGTIEGGPGLAPLKEPSAHGTHAPHRRTTWATQKLPLLRRDVSELSASDNHALALLLHLCAVCVHTYVQPGCRLSGSKHIQSGLSASKHMRSQSHQLCYSCFQSSIMIC